MNMQFGNREKIATLTILCLLTIGAVHYFVFMGKAHAYRSAYEDYRRSMYQWRTMVSSQDEPKINKYIEANQALEDYITGLMKDLGLDMDPNYFEQDEKKKVKKYQEDLIEVINQIADLRKTHKNIRLSFLDWNNGAGWDIPSRLPPNLSSLKMWDLVDKLRVLALTIKVLNNPVERQAKMAEYNGYLAQLGIDANHLAVISRYGDIVPTVKKLAHARLIWTQKLQDEKRGVARIPIKTREELHELLQIRLPEDPEVLYHTIKQLRFLLKLVALAEKNEVEEIRNVRLQPIRKIDQIIENGKPRLVSEIHFDQQAILGRQAFWQAARSAPRTGWGRQPATGGRYPYGTATGPYGSPGMQGPGGTGTQGGGMGMLEPTPTPEPQPVPGGVWIGNAVPIEMGFVAPWEKALNFLYVVSHNHNPFEVDSVRFQTIFGEGGKVFAIATFVPMALVDGLQMYFQPQTTQTLTAASPPRPGGPVGRGPGPRAPVAPARPGRLGVR